MSSFFVGSIVISRWPSSDTLLFPDLYGPQSRFPTRTGAHRFKTRDIARANTPGFRQLYGCLVAARQPNRLQFPPDCQVTTLGNHK